MSPSPLPAARLMALAGCLEAGIPPEEVLVTATTNGARTAGLLADRGTLEPGKRADLVLLDRDPREEIGATRETLRVMQGGEFVDPDSLLRSVVESPETDGADGSRGGSRD